MLKRQAPGPDGCPMAAEPHPRPPPVSRMQADRPDGVRGCRPSVPASGTQSHLLGHEPVSRQACSPPRATGGDNVMMAGRGLFRASRGPRSGFGRILTLVDTSRSAPHRPPRASSVASTMYSAPPRKVRMCHPFAVRGEFRSLLPTASPPTLTQPGRHRRLSNELAHDTAAAAAP